MARDVFISYSSKDKAVADAICEAVESRDIACWIAPRDILPGREWSEAIIDALSECRVMIVVFSSHANDSKQVKREAERAVNKGMALLPFRIEETLPSGAMEYYFSTSHWLDAFTPPLEDHFERLVATVQNLLSGSSAWTRPNAQTIARHDAPARETPREAASLPANTGPNENAGTNQQEEDRNRKLP